MSHPDPVRRRVASRPVLQVASVVLAGALLLAACGSDDPLSGGDVVVDGVGCTISESERRADDVPEVEAGAKVTADVVSKDLIEAEEDACEVGSGTYLTVDLLGAKAADGAVVTSTWEDGRPLTVQVGIGQLIVGLETGMAGMKVGARRQIVVPADQAYGAEGFEEQGIGPDEDLVYIVDLISITDAPVYCNPPQALPDGTREGKPELVALPAQPATGEVEVTVLSEGDGAEVTATSWVTLDFVEVSCATGAETASSWSEPEAAKVAMAEATADPLGTVTSKPKGWSDGIVGQKVGSTIQIDIPAELGYGPQGSPPTIGPNDPLTVVATLIASEEAPTEEELAAGPTECAPVAPIEGGGTGGKPETVALPSEPVKDEVVTTVLTEGDGPEIGEASYAKVNYLGISCATGDEFDSSWTNGNPITVALGTAAPTDTNFSVIEGWTEGLTGEKQGSLVQLDIPAAKAYGEAGSPPSIGPNDPLTFVIEILEVSDEPIA